MPLKDPDKKREYQRGFYARNREKTIEAVRRRKQEVYVGVCLNCGGPTHGDRPKRIPDYCAKPVCRSAQWRAKRGKMLEKGKTMFTLDEALDKIEARRTAPPSPGPPPVRTPRPK